MKKKSKTFTKIDELTSRFPDWTSYLDLLIAPPTAEEALEQYPELRTDVILSHPMKLTTFGVPMISLYYKQRLEGVPHKLASMVASQRGPRVNTDDTFFAPMKTLSEQFASESELKVMLRIAKKQGFTPGMNHVYVPQLARFRGDREAYVSRTDGRAQIRKICEQRGQELSVNTSDSSMKATHRQPESDPYESAPKIAENLIGKYANRMAKKDPSLRGKSRRELREMVIQKHGPST